MNLRSNPLERKTARTRVVVPPAIGLYNRDDWYCWRCKIKDQLDRAGGMRVLTDADAQDCARTIARRLASLDILGGPGSPLIGTSMMFDEDVHVLNAYIDELEDWLWEHGVWPG